MKAISRPEQSWMFNAKELKEKFVNMDKTTFRNKMSMPTSPSKN
jgi:hypothetical protein